MEIVEFWDGRVLSGLVSFIKQNSSNLGEINFFIAYGFDKFFKSILADTFFVIPLVDFCLHILCFLTTS